MSKLWWLAVWLIEPAHRNRQHLKKACVKMWNTAPVQAPTPRPIIMYPELRHGGVGEHLLDVVLHEGQRGRDDHGDAADHGDQVERLAERVDLETDVEHGVEAGDEVHAGDDHRRGVQQRRHRGGAGHGVGEPRVQRELARLAHARR